MQKHVTDLKPGELVPIYTNGPMGFGLQKLEGRFGEVTRNTFGETCGVTFIPKRCRKDRLIMTYYNPTILVARGHGLPDAPPNFSAPVSSQGGKVRTSEGRYSNCDPRWVKDLDNATESVTFALEIRG